MNSPDPVRWFDALGSCATCGKRATGRLMGPRNESYGRYCEPCAMKRLNAADRARAALAETQRSSSDEPAK